MTSQSAYYSSVQNFLSLLDRPTLTRFEALTTDEQRFDFVASLDFVKSSFRVHPSTGFSKSLAEAVKARKEGNKHYTDGKLDEALSCYNRCIALAPPPPSLEKKKAGGGDTKKTGGQEESAKVKKTAEAMMETELSLALGNRSACLLLMKKYESCLEDIRLALIYGYPQQLQYKVYDRMGRALIELDRLGDASEAFENGISLLQDVSSIKQDQKNEIEKGMMEKLDMCSINDDEPDPVRTRSQHQERDVTNTHSTKESSTIPRLSGEANLQYPGASDAFDVLYSAERGRYAVATRKVAVGEVLMAEQPHASVLGEDFFNLRCYNCFTSLVLPYACHGCTKVRYCSDHCRQASWDSHHGVECPFLERLLSSGTGPMARLALKVLIVTGLDRLLKHKNNPAADSAEAQQSLFADGGVYVGGFAAIYSLVTHSDSRPVTDLLQYTILAVWLVRVLQKANFFEKIGDSIPNNVADRQTVDGHLTSIVGGMVLHVLQVISCNGLDITEMTIAETLHKSHPISIGLAVYPTVSLLNHSCDPSVELVFYRNTCVARTIQTVDAGDELPIDYGFVYYSTPKEQRQTALKSQYLFDCNCIACFADWGLTGKLMCGVPYFRCSECSSHLPSVVKYHESGSDKELFCPGCHVSYDPMERVGHLHYSQSRAEQAIEEARRFLIDKAIPVLESHMTLMRNCLVLPWKEYVTCLSTLKQCYRMQGNRRKY